MSRLAPPGGSLRAVGTCLDEGLVQAIFPGAVAVVMHDGAAVGARGAIALDAPVAPLCHRSPAKEKPG